MKIESDFMLFECTEDLSLRKQKKLEVLDEFEVARLQHQSHPQNQYSNAFNLEQEFSIDEDLAELSLEEADLYPDASYGMMNETATVDVNVDIQIQPYTFYPKQSEFPKFLPKTINLSVFLLQFNPIKFK